MGGVVPKSSETDFSPDKVAFKKKKKLVLGWRHDSSSRGPA
jgi:hypothetical protein